MAREFISAGAETTLTCNSLLAAGDKTEAVTLSSSSVILTRSSEYVDSEDVYLKDKMDDIIILDHQLHSLHMSNLMRTTVSASVCSGTVFVDNCVNSVLEFGGHQVRLHNLRDCKIYLFCNTACIIEDCHGLQIYQYRRNLTAAESECNMWANVQDFSFNPDSFTLCY